MTDRPSGPLPSKVQIGRPTVVIVNGDGSSSTTVVPPQLPKE